MNSALIASPVGEYQVVTDHKDGLLVSSEDEWFHAIDRLISDRKCRKSLTAEGWNKVNAEWNWKNPEARAKWKPVVDVLDRW